MVTKNLVISGIVQGVGFRYSMQGKAKDLSVTGWVRNLSDGSVEAVVQGTAEQVDEMIRWAKKGPTGARVDQVEVSDATGKFSDFSINFSH
jgi:acylphosphatase